MRKDMFKVIVERPRRGALRHVGWRRMRDEDVPTIATMRPHRSMSKDLNENLAPLERFFEKRVGRYWPKVYSEVCEHISIRNAVQKHVRDHIEDIVAVKTVKRQGEILVQDRLWGLVPLGKRPGKRFYVHPVSQVLMCNKHWLRPRARRKAREEARKAELAKRFRAVGPYCARHKMDGVWYELRLSPLPEGHDAAQFDRWRRELRDGQALVTVTREELAQRIPGYTIAKRQLTTRELADADLANDVHD